MDIQNQVNEMVKFLRMAVIKHLLLTDLYKYAASKTVDDAELEWRANEIFKMPISTGNLKRLFEDCHEYVREIGMYDGPVRIADLEFCIKKRSVGYKCINEFPRNWLPKKSDTELRALPEFKALAQLYISNGGKAIPPTDSENENLKFIKQIANHIGAEHAV